LHLFGLKLLAEVLEKVLLQLVAGKSAAYLHLVLLASNINYLYLDQFLLQLGGIEHHGGGYK
jgi:hypothetical protein